MYRLVYLLLPLLAVSSSKPSRREPTATESAWASVPVRGTVSLRPVRWSVVGGSGPRDVVSGRSVPVTVQADIAKGWHLYSLTQKPGGPIPLRIGLLSAGDVLMRGVIKAPQPVRAFDRNFGIETETYSGSPRFTVPVGVPGRSPTGVRKFQIGARYQVCSEKVCLPDRKSVV